MGNAYSHCPFSSNRGLHMSHEMGMRPRKTASCNDRKMLQVNEMNLLALALHPRNLRKRHMKKGLAWLNVVRKIASWLWLRPTVCCFIVNSKGQDVQAFSKWEISRTMTLKLSGKGVHVGFISTRLAGTDGVSLETRKWARCFEQQGFTCYYLAGELDHPPQCSMLVEEAHFNHPDIKYLNDVCYGVKTRTPDITRKIHEMKEALKAKLYAFIDQFNLNLLVTENCLCIPINLPLGMAITEVLAETGIKTIAHHHDLFWERKRFLTNAVWDILNMSFPPHMPNIHHVIINSSADNQLSLRTGISGTLIPNVMNFENPPEVLDDYATDVREAFGIAPDECFILQPTRIVQRKGIEHAIELVSRLGLKAKLLISHAAGDEGYEYEKRIREYSKFLNVETIFAADRISEHRGKTADGKKKYSLGDVYPHADLITYPSEFEGFGNAFLEAIYYRKPIVVNNYSIFSFDIKPKGFKVIEFDGFITEDTVRQTRELLEHPDIRNAWIEHNYTMAIRYYSYSVLRRRLANITADCLGYKHIAQVQEEML